jgi:hypothetical protein
MSPIGPKRRFTAMQRYDRSWNTSRHGADIVNARLQPLSRLAYRQPPALQLRQLGDIGGDRCRAAQRRRSLRYAELLHGAEPGDALSLAAVGYFGEAGEAGALREVRCRVFCS